MKFLLNDGVRSRCCMIALCALLLSRVNFAEESGGGEEPPNIEIFQVEEEWELVVQSADTATTAPQIQCAIAPTSSLASHYGTLELNHRSAFNYQPGGVHLHLWEGEVLLNSACDDNHSVLSTPSETIRWKTIMTIYEGRLYIDIDDGESQTWGSFGRGMFLSVPTQLENLNGYSPEFSVSQSGVGFAANRVRSLKLKRVTARAKGGLEVIDNNVRTVHELPQ